MLMMMMMMMMMIIAMMMNMIQAGLQSHESVRRAQGFTAIERLGMPMSRLLEKMPVLA